MALPVTACAVGPDYRPSTTDKLGVPVGYSVPTESTRAGGLTRWWTNLDDPLLSDLVERGRVANLDIARAVTRLRQAREAMVQARSALFPAVNGSSGYSRSESLAGANVGGADNFSTGVDVGYQLDLFGGNRRNGEAVGAQYQASGFDYATVLTSIEAEIARNYVIARLQQAQLANARKSLAIQDENLEIAGFRVQAGLVSSLDTEQARGQRAQTAATIPTIEANLIVTISRLGVLLGQAPGTLRGELQAAKPIPRGPETIAVGVPADVLRQRPDVRTAERALAAATAQIGVAEAQLYPALSIGGSFSSGGSAIRSMLDMITGRIFANIAQTIFDAGRTRAQVRSNVAAAEGAFLNYKQTVLLALEDVENAIVALHSAQRRERAFAIAFEAADNSAILSRSQYRSGLTDFTTLNSSESQLLSARNGLSQAQADQATALVQLYLALGGGWDASTIPTADTPAATSQDR